MYRLQELSNYLNVVKILREYDEQAGCIKLTMQKRN